MHKIREKSDCLKVERERVKYEKVKAVARLWSSLRVKSRILVQRLSTNTDYFTISAWYAMSA